jgi:hypothetical protein
MKNDFVKIQDIIYSVDNLAQIDVCEVLIKNFKVTYLSEGHDYSFVLVGILEATKQLKFNK